MYTAKKLFKAQFFAVRTKVRAMSDERLFDLDSECYNFTLPTHYYRFVRKEIARRFPGINSLDALTVKPSDLVEVVPTPSDEETEENSLRDLLARMMSA